MFTARWSRWGLVALLSLGLTACDSPGSEYKTPRDVVLASRIFKAEPLAEPLHTSCPSEARRCNALTDRLSNSPFHEVVAQELGLEGIQWQHTGVGYQATLKHVEVFVVTLGNPPREFARITVNKR